MFFLVFSSCPCRYPVLLAVFSVLFHVKRVTQPGRCSLSFFTCKAKVRIIMLSLPPLFLGGFVMSLEMWHEIHLEKARMQMLAQTLRP